ncbi:phasin family protein [Novosphingobium sp.]|uniref:phasin family protein n=1 Tax=Novosphingobium sp. TaxID=1874826 RepID=UPI00286D56E7|nr:phasin family protein [Novosphingobium sp.]
MATAPEAKIDLAKADAAAEKAYAEAAAKVETTAKAEAAPAVKAEKAPVAKKIVAAKPAAKKAPAKKVAAPKKIIKKAAAPKVLAAKTAPVSTLKDTIMTKTKTVTEDFTAKVKDVVADAQDRAKVAFEKTQAYAADYGDFTKGNVEALVASGKVLAAGLQDMGKDMVAEGKTALETMTADVKDLAAVKSPADFFKLQGEILRRNFDAAVSTGSKRSETVVKMATEAFAPIQTRVSLAVEKVKQAA